MFRNRAASSRWSQIVTCLLSLQLIGVATSGLAKDRIQLGRDLFNHSWKPNDPLSPNGDGLGPMFNANSCMACHHLGGVGGAGGLAQNIDLLTDSSVVGCAGHGTVSA